MADDTVAQTQAVRDLFWTIQSPSLVATSEAIVPALEIDAQAIDPVFLLKFIRQAPEYRVGRYFERLVHFYLLHIRQFEMVAQGRQIHHDGRTTGELDFVFRDHDGRLCHWETAVKFYLHLQERQVSGSHLIGPNPADCFEEKLRRLYSHQLPLSASVFPDIAEQRALVRGRIFYHVHCDRADTSLLPDTLAADHLRSLWCHERDFGEYAAHALPDIAAGRIQTKPHWLAEEVTRLSDKDCLAPISLVQAAAAHFRTSRRPVLISLLQTRGAQLVEDSRLFVVHNTWPDG